ncbi:MAG: hypothetical protein P4K86_04135 [Terracidiphilus sp.]|nr:hypothetical protein [Terracidiphilus sp.]
MKRNYLVNYLLVLVFSVLGFAVMGYHPGIEDDGVYLSAVKSNVNPALYPHDAEFFRTQLQATLFDKWVAGFIHWTGIPVAATELLWQFASIALILFGCWSIARKLFSDPRAQWAGVAMVGAMLTLPVAGTALYLADQHLHPRNVATAIILLAISRILAGKRWQAAPLLLLSFFLHPIMAAMGISFCIFLVVAMLDPVQDWLRKRHWTGSSATVAAFVPLGWMFEKPTPIWHQALDTRTYYFLYQWAWYEWLGAIAPLFLFWLLWRVAEKRSNRLLARFALAVLAYGVFQQAVAMVMLGTPALVRLTPLQPMRFLHLIYFFMALIAGSLLGKYLLKARVWRWALFLLIVNGGMFAAQRDQFSGSDHLELPGRQSANPWLQAFDWIRQNTPTDAYFVLDPFYMAKPGEDYHSFRALAERSQLADAIKDTAVVTQVPELGPEWKRQVEAQASWPNFKLADFERLKKEFGANWALVSYPQPAGLQCHWHNDLLAVCQIP